MADNVSSAKRKYIMSQIRGKWTRQERLVHNYLKGRKIRHKMHPKMVGNPDIIFKDKKIAVFLDGCFWHGCPKCYRKPASNVKYWKKKIASNKKNAKLANSSLKKSGWKVVRIWEHQMKDVGAEEIFRSL